MSEARHTPGPWVVGDESWEGDGAGGIVVEAQDGLMVALVYCPTDRGEPENATPTDRANAEFIVRAVNSHADLLAALEALMEIQDCTGDCWCVEAGNPGTCEACRARAAITKARGVAWPEFPGDKPANSGGG